MQDVQQVSLRGPLPCGQSDLLTGSVSGSSRVYYQADISESVLQNIADFLILSVCQTQESAAPVQMDAHHHRASCPEYPVRRSVPSGRKRNLLLCNEIPCS